MRKKNLILIGGLPQSLLNFRGRLISAIILKGYSVTGMADSKDLDVKTALFKKGAGYEIYPLLRNSLSPISDLKTLFALRKTFKDLAPTVILAYTIKPIVWGGIASSVVPNSRFYALVTGLGFSFQKGGFWRGLLCDLTTLLYRVSLKRAQRVIFQNQDNLNEFVTRKIVKINKCSLVNGSGVDLVRFGFTKQPAGAIVFLMIGRLLGAKGIREYVEAARLVKSKYSSVKFQLLGPTDKSPDGIPLSDVESWDAEGALEYLGSANDVRPYLEKCHVYVLPSYHEGMPRTVLEAMAIGRPILTTDVPGCRETVIPGENGYLVPMADSSALAERMIWFIENSNDFDRMGKASRALAEKKFDVNMINAHLIEIMNL